MKILAVDNERFQLNLLTDSIREAVPNCDLAMFLNPMEALEWAKANRPEIAFLDIQMPVMDGIALAKELKRNDPKVNLIFVTGFYEEYMGRAIPTHFSGYLQKPATAAAVKDELDNLRFPVTELGVSHQIMAQCFGRFEITADGAPIRFSRDKTKELLAYLIDCYGESVNGDELCEALFGDMTSNSSRKSALRNCAADLKATLHEVGADDLFVKGFNSYAVNRTKMACDYFAWMDSDPQAIRAFRGEYMSQYSWAEETLHEILEPTK